jgi:glycerophosphoryl diester phosphodiesterase
MNTIKFEKKNALVVAHRGLSGIERENTNAAFVAAGNRSYYGIETDFHRTADGKFIISHDQSLKRVSGEDIDVEAVSLTVAQQVVLLDMDRTKGRADLRAPSLENYISICKKYEKHCVLELKSIFTEEETASYIELIRGLGYLEHVTFISFYYENLVKIRAYYPEASVQFLFSELTDEIAENVKRDRFDVDAYFKTLTKEAIDDFHAAGLKVNCWTVDTAEDGEKMAAWGVDFITSNILE